MRRWIAIFEIILTMLVLCLGIDHRAVLAVTSESYFTFKDGTITTYTGPETVVDIPATIGGKAVTALGNDCFRDNSSVTSITIPSSVTSLGDYCFYSCTGLTNITIPNSVTSLGYCCFYSCTGLTNITIPSSVTSLGIGCFCGCTGLINITIPSSVTSLGDYCFGGCTRLTNITIPSSVTSLGGNCFAGCTGLTNITIPSSVTSLGDYCFYGCTGLTNITIPSSVTSLGAGCFEGCTGLTNITIPSSVTSLGGVCFRGCTGLTNITIPSSVTSLGVGCFYNCTGLTNITIPSSVTRLGASCFHSCTGLTNITIPSSVTSLGGDCFGSCTGLTNITIPSSVTSLGGYCFEGCTGLTNITIPSSVTSLGIGCFEGCTGLTNITIPSSVTSLGDNCFAGCTSLTDVKIKFVSNFPYGTTATYTVSDKILAAGSWTCTNCSYSGSAVTLDTAIPGSREATVNYSGRTLTLVYQVQSGFELTIGNGSQIEGGTGTTSVCSFTVSLSSAATGIVKVNYGTHDGTATAGEDYTAASGTLTFAVGESSQTINVTINGDTQYETDETFYVILDNPVNAVIATSQATGTITNDDNQPTVSVAANSLSQTEGNSGSSAYNFTVSLSNASYQTVTVDYATADNTATTKDSDYVAVNGTLTFSPGETSKTIGVSIYGDTKYESNESFDLNLSNSTNATLATSRATGTILNDDSDPAPILTAVSPFTGAAGVKLNTTFSMTFSEAVTAGSGNIVIYKKDGTLVEKIATASTTIHDANVTITPTNRLAAATDYYVLVDATAFQDTAGNAYAGISDVSAWTFATVPSSIGITFSRPTEGAKLNINTGSMVIAKLTDNGAGIDSSKVTVRIDNGAAVKPLPPIKTTDGYTLYYVITGVHYDTVNKTHTIMVSADDFAGGTSTATITFIMEPKRNGFGFGRLRFD